MHVTQILDHITHKNLLIGLLNARSLAIVMFTKVSNVYHLMVVSTLLVMSFFMSLAFLLLTNLNHQILHQIFPLFLFLFVFLLYLYVRNQYLSMWLMSPYQLLHVFLTPPLALLLVLLLFCLLCRPLTCRLSHQYLLLMVPLVPQIRCNTFPLAFNLSLLKCSLYINQ